MPLRLACSLFVAICLDAQVQVEVLGRSVYHAGANAASAALPARLIAAAPDDTIYFTSGSTVYRLWPGGRIDYIGGGYSAGFGYRPPAVWMIGENATFQPTALAVDALGDLYVTTSDSLWHRDARTGLFRALQPRPGLRSCAVFAAVPAHGRWIYYDFCVRKIVEYNMLTGQRTEIAGRGTESFDENPETIAAAEANVNGIRALAASPDGTVYLAMPSGRLSILDAARRTVRSVSLPSNTSVTALTVTNDGMLQVGTFEGLILRYDPALGSVVFAWGRPGRIEALDSNNAGNLLIASAQSISRLNANGQPETLLEGRSRLPEGESAASGGLGQLSEITVHSNGDIYFIDTSANRIAKMDPQGRVTTLAGSPTLNRNQNENTPPLDYYLFSPQALAVMPDGTVLFHENGRVAMLRPDANRLQTLYRTDAGSFSDCGQAAASASGNNVVFFDPKACQVLLLSPAAASPVLRRWPEQVPSPRPAYLSLRRLSVDSGGAVYWLGAANDRSFRLYRLPANSADLETVFKFDTFFRLAQVYSDGRDRLFMLENETAIFRIDPTAGTLRLIPSLTVGPNPESGALLRTPTSFHPAPAGSYIVYDANGGRLLRITGLD